MPQPRARADSPTRNSPRSTATWSTRGSTSGPIEAPAELPVSARARAGPGPLALPLLVLAGGRCGAQVLALQQCPGPADRHRERGDHQVGRGKDQGVIIRMDEQDDADDQLV